MMKKFFILLAVLTVSVSSFAFQDGDTICISGTKSNGVTYYLDPSLVNHATTSLNNSCLLIVESLDNDQYALKTLDGQYLRCNNGNFGLGAQQAFSYTLNCFVVEPTATFIYVNEWYSYWQYTDGFILTFNKGDWNESINWWNVGQDTPITETTISNKIISNNGYPAEPHVMHHGNKVLLHAFALSGDAEIPFSGSSSNKQLTARCTLQESIFAEDNPNIAINIGEPQEITNAETLSSTIGNPSITLKNGEFNIGTITTTEDYWNIPLNGTVQPVGTTTLTDTLIAAIVFNGTTYTAKLPVCQVRGVEISLDSISYNLTPQNINILAQGGTYTLTANAKHYSGDVLNLSNGDKIGDILEDDIVLSLNTTNVSASQSWVNYTCDNNTITINIPENKTGVARTATITWAQSIDCAESTHPINVVCNLRQGIPFEGADTLLVHQRGVTGEDFDSKGLQRTHEIHKTIITDKVTNIKLHIHQNTYQGWYRWYNYDNQHSIPSSQWSIFPSAGSQKPFINIGNEANGTDQGCYLPYKSPVKNPWDGTVVMTQHIYNAGSIQDAEVYPYTDGATHRIALDVSQYTDYEYTSNTIVEPTLSYRTIYTIVGPDSMAQAMELCHNTTKFLEEYVIVAPIVIKDQNTLNLKTLFEFNSNSYNYGYTYYDNATSSYKQLKESNIKLYINGVMQTNLPGAENYVTITRPTTPSTDTITYTLVSTNGYNIARFKVVFKDPDIIGPKEEDPLSGRAIMTTKEMDDNFVLLAKYDFDFAKPGTTEFTQYNHPLPWDECQYGFAFPNLQGYPTGNTPTYQREKGMTFPYLGEYTIVNRLHNSNQPGNIPDPNFPHNSINWLEAPAEQRGGAENGFMMYCDGTRSQGKIASLHINADLCAGQEVFCSLWLNAVNQNSNFQIELVGIDNYGKEHFVTILLTGAIPYPYGVWKQIMFPINIKDEYETYKINFYNFSPSDAQNDFLIDDIRIYSTHAPVTISQANGSCANSQGNTDDVIIVSRIDFSLTSEGDNNINTNQPIFYQWRNTADNSILNFDYINANAEKTYGYFVANGSSTYSSLNSLVTAHIETPSVNCGFVTEDIDGTTKTVFYIVQDLPVVKNGTYQLQLTTDPSNLGFVTECSMQAKIRVKEEARLKFQGEVQYPPVKSDLCVSQEYNLGIKVRGEIISSGNSIKEIEGECLADWILLNSPDTTSFYADFGVYYQWVFNALVNDLRRPSSKNDINTNRTVNSLADVDISNLLDPKSFDILKKLDDKGRVLHLATLEVSSYLAPLSGSLYYVVFPIASTGVSTEDNTITVPVCTEPIFVELTTGSDTYEHYLTLGQNPTITPSVISQRPVRVRASQADATSQFNVAIQDFRDVLINNVKLIESNDPDFVEGTSIYDLTPVKNLDELSPNSNLVLLAPAASGNTLTPKQGYEYTFQINLMLPGGATIDDNGCDVGFTKFTLYVVPDNLKWTPGVLNSNAWNNDANWTMCDEMGNEITTGQKGFVPMSHSNVFIPDFGADGNYPILPAGKDKADCQLIPIEEGAKAYISYDINYEANTCKNIHFAPNAQVVNQHKLVYEKAWVDMQVPTANWMIVAPALQDMVFGDMYIPEDNDESTTLWEPNGICTTRSAEGYAFWQSIFNNTATLLSLSGGALKSTDITSSTWSEPTNQLDVPYHIGQGTSLLGFGPIGANPASVTVRLPKAETIYHYYQGDRELPNTVNVDRTNSAKLAYAPTETAGKMAQTFDLGNKAAGEWFVFGNPTMAYIDMDLFLTENNLSKTFYYVNESNPSAGISAGNQYTSGNYLLPPMRGVLVKSNTAATGTTLKLKVTPEMLCLRNANAKELVGTKKNAPSAIKPYTHMLSVYAQRNDASSLLIVGESNTASDSIVAEEDAPLMVATDVNGFYSDDVFSSIFSIYANEQDTALSIDMRKEMKMVPVCFTNIADNDTVTPFKVTFGGVSSFGRDIHFVDTKTNTSIRLIDGLRIQIECPQNDEKRYYIEWADMPEEETGLMDIDSENSLTPAEINIRLAGDQKAIVDATETIQNIFVYNALGQMVESLKVGNNFAEVTLPMGVSIISVKTASQVKNEIVLIK